MVLQMMIVPLLMVELVSVPVSVGNQLGQWQWRWELDGVVKQEQQQTTLELRREGFGTNGKASVTQENGECEQQMFERAVTRVRRFDAESVGFMHHAGVARSD